MQEIKILKYKSVKDASSNQQVRLCSIVRNGETEYVTWLWSADTQYGHGHYYGADEKAAKQDFFARS